MFFLLWVLFCCGCATRFFFCCGCSARFFFCCGCAAFVVAGARCVFFAARVCGAVCRALFFAAGMHAACFLLLRVRGAFLFSLTHSLAARRPESTNSKKHTQQKKTRVPPCIPKPELQSEDPERLNPSKEEP